MRVRLINRLNKAKQQSYCSLAGQNSFSFTSLMFAGLIAAMVYIFAITGANFKQLVIVQGVFVLWVIFSIVFTRDRIEFSAYSIFALLILALVLISNLFVNINNYDVIDGDLAFAIAHVGGILFFAFAAQWAVSNLQPDCILKSIAWMLAPLVILALAMGLIDAQTSRSTPFGVHPNWWGEVAFGFILCSLVLNRMMTKVFFIVIGIGLMITVQSRGALLAVTVSIFAYLLVQHRPLGIVSKKKLKIFGVIMIAGLVLGMMTGMWLTILDIIESKVLFLNDPYRGADSGLTGRVAGWLVAIEIFVENPIFGQGFDTLLEVHNGFIRWAGEGGVLLLGVMLLLIITALVQSWCSHNDWVFAALLGIMAYMMTYPRALNLNLVGMLFLMALFPWKGVPVQKK